MKSVKRPRRKQPYGDVASHVEQRMRSPHFRDEWKQNEADMSLAKQLIQLRTQQSLTQAQVAEMVGTTQSSLSRLERHPPRRPTPLLRRLADLYRRELVVQIRLIAPG